MKTLKLVRSFKGPDYTIGKLYLDETYLCDTLEDTVRDKKIAGETAIPAGTYNCEWTYSSRFKRVLPEVFNVPGFTGVRIHTGNHKDNTSGCVLVGQNKVKGQVINSKATFSALEEVLPFKFILRII